MAAPFILPAHWPAPPRIRALTTLRHGLGGSLPPFDTLNLGNRTSAEGDAPEWVERNRAVLAGRWSCRARRTGCGRCTAWTWYG